MNVCPFSEALPSVERAHEPRREPPKHGIRKKVGATIMLTAAATLAALGYEATQQPESPVMGHSNNIHTPTTRKAQSPNTTNPDALPDHLYIETPESDFPYIEESLLDTPERLVPDILEEPAPTPAIPNPYATELFNREVEPLPFNHMTYYLHDTLREVSFNEQAASTGANWFVDRGKNPPLTQKFSQRVAVHSAGEESPLDLQYTEGLFTAVQFYMAHEDRDQLDMAGYIGVQTRNYHNGQRPAFQFSIWESSGVQPYEGSFGDAFTHEGSGHYISSPLQESYAGEYEFYVEMLPHPNDPSKKQIEGSVVYDGVRQAFGVIDVPDSVSDFYAFSTFVEHYTPENTPCKEIPLASSTFLAPTLYRTDGATVRPDQVHLDRESYPDCNNVGSTHYEEALGTTTIMLGNASSVSVRPDIATQR